MSWRGRREHLFQVAATVESGRLRGARGRLDELHAQRGHPEEHRGAAQLRPPARGRTPVRTCGRAHPRIRGGGGGQSQGARLRARTAFGHRRMARSSHHRAVHHCRLVAGRHRPLPARPLGNLGRPHRLRFGRLPSALGPLHRLRKLRAVLSSARAALSAVARRQEETRAAHQHHQLLRGGPVLQCDRLRGGRHLHQPGDGRAGSRFGSLDAAMAIGSGSVEVHGLLRHLDPVLPLRQAGPEHLHHALERPHHKDASGCARLRDRRSGGPEEGAAGADGPGGGPGGRGRRGRRFRIRRDAAGGGTLPRLLAATPAGSRLLASRAEASSSRARSC